jgi:hypothetical protein
MNLKEAPLVGNLINISAVFPV